VASALTAVERALECIFAELDDAGASCALIGGLGEEFTRAIGNTAG